MVRGILCKEIIDKGNWQLSILNKFHEYRLHDKMYLLHHAFC